MPPQIPSALCVEVPVLHHLFCVDLILQIRGQMRMLHRKHHPGRNPGIKKKKKSNTLLFFIFH